MATAAQKEANRRNAQKSTGPRTEEGKARASRNHLSHGFTSATLFFIPGEDREEFNLLLADLFNEYQPATPTEQILLEKMAQNQWLSLRAYRLQAMFLSGTMETGRIPKDFGLLIRYHQSSDRGFLKARTELLNAQKERKKSEIGFESQTPADPPQLPVQDPAETSFEDGLKTLSDQELHEAFQAMSKAAAEDQEARRKGA